MSDLLELFRVKSLSELVSFQLDELGLVTLAFASNTLWAQLISADNTNMAIPTTNFKVKHDPCKKT